MLPTKTDDWFVKEKFELVNKFVKEAFYKLLAPHLRYIVN